MNAALRFVTLVLFATQAVAAGGSYAICRYTGQVMDSPCCPSATEAGQPGTRLDRAECCEVFQAERTVVAVVVPQEQGKPRDCHVAPPFVSVLPAAASEFETTVALHARDADPPERLRLHLRVRRLLL